MKLKVYFPSGKTATYHNNIESLIKSFSLAGIRYDLVDSGSVLARSPR